MLFLHQSFLLQPGHCCVPGTQMRCIRAACGRRGAHLQCGMEGNSGKRRLTPAPSPLALPLPGPVSVPGGLGRFLGRSPFAPALALLASGSLSPSSAVAMVWRVTVIPRERVSPVCDCRRTCAPCLRFLLRIGRSQPRTSLPRALLPCAYTCHLLCLVAALPPHGHPPVAAQPPQSPGRTPLQTPCPIGMCDPSDACAAADSKCAVGSVASEA